MRIAAAKLMLNCRDAPKTLQSETETKTET
jgi:hypothetical protein